MGRVLAAFFIFLALGTPWGGSVPALADGPSAPPARSISVYAAGRVLVRYKPGQGPTAGAQIIPGIGTAVLDVNSGEEMEALAILKSDPAVDFAELDGVTLSLSEPSDPLFSFQRWNLEAIRAPEAWDALRNLDGPTVAIVDSGVDLTHPDLTGRIVPGIDFIEGDDQPQDRYGHGTHLAGIIAASPNNGVGVAGMAPGSSVMPVRVLDNIGMGRASDLARGIVWAADHGAKVINLSVAAPLGGDTLMNAVQYALDKGALVVAAAGNSYMDGNPPIYPASYPGVVAVSATTNSGGHASYSSSGAFVDLAAPGGDPQGPNDQNLLHLVTSTYSRIAGSPYAALAGTSQAAAHVSGAAALVWTANPSLTAAQVRSTLESTAEHSGTGKRDDLFGHGLVNVEAAVLAARNAPGWAVRIYLPEISTN